MKCKYCGKEFDNKGSLLSHYREHKKEVIEEFEEINEVEQKESVEKEKSIPVDWCANAQYLGNNTMLCMRVLGIKKGNNIVITQVDLI